MKEKVLTSLGIAAFILFFMSALIFEDKIRSIKYDESYPNWVRYVIMLIPER